MRVKEVRETNLNYTKFTNLQSEEPKVNITELNARLNQIKKENFYSTVKTIVISLACISIVAVISIAL
jgi:hypothetical protein